MARSSVDRARDRVARVASHVDASSATRDDGRDARARAMAAHVASNAAGAVVHASDDATPWIDVDQRRIDAFAACADDHQFIHARDAPGRRDRARIPDAEPADAGDGVAHDARVVLARRQLRPQSRPFRRARARGRARSRAVDQNRRLSRVTRRRGRRDRVFSRIRNRAERARRRGVASRARVGRVLGRPSLRLSGPRFASSRALVSLFSPPSSSLEPIVALRGSDSSNSVARAASVPADFAPRISRARVRSRHTETPRRSRARASRAVARRARRVFARVSTTATGFARRRRRARRVRGRIREN